MIFFCAGTARAEPLHPLFEPTDLELEKPGVVDIDLQTGVMFGRAPRFALADVEIDVGLANRVELDIDFAFHQLGDQARFYGEPLWIASKIGLFDIRGVACGVQLGPRIPTIEGGAGIGYAGLALVGWTWGRLQFVANVGGVIDPGSTIVRRPTGAIFGLDFTVPLVRNLAMTAEIAGSAVTEGPGEAHHTIGLAWNPSPWFQASVTLLTGRFANGDRAGVLFGISPKAPLFP